MATVQLRVSTKVDKTIGKGEILLRFFHGKIDERNDALPNSAYEMSAKEIARWTMIDGIAIRDAWEYLSQW